MEEVVSNVLDVSELEKRKHELRIEMSLQADLVHEFIKQNTKFIQDQDEYQKKYEEFTEQYTKVSEELNFVEENIQDKLVRMSQIKEFLIAIKEHNILHDFDKDLWITTVKEIEVKEDGGLIFYFNRGTSITIEGR